jgi:hypothetical protein
MAVERSPCTSGFAVRINMQDNPSDFTPVRTFRVRVKQAKLGDEVFFVVSGQHEVGRSRIGDIGIKRERVSNYLFVDAISTSSLTY